MSTRSPLLIPLVAALVTTACGKDNACSCDLIAAESICVEYSALDNPLYALQLEATCESGLSGLCDTLGGTYTMDQACPTDGLIAECEVEVVTYANTKYFYGTGAEPYAPTDPDFEEDCASTGTVTVY